MKYTPEVNQAYFVGETAEIRKAGFEGKKYIAKKEIKYWGFQKRANMERKYVIRRRLLSALLLLIIVSTTGFFGFTAVDKTMDLIKVGKVEKVSKNTTQLTEKELEKVSEKVTLLDTKVESDLSEKIQAQQTKGKVVYPQGYEGDFIKQIENEAIKVANAYGLYPSIMIAQAIIESDWGRSGLSTQANNYFGVKARSDQKFVTMPTMEFYNGEWVTINDNFAYYDTIEESMESNAILLHYGITNAPEFYSGTWRENTESYYQAVQGLQGKYATAPDYAEILINIIHTYGLNYLD